MDLQYTVKKLDFGSVVTEHTAQRKRTRGMQDGEAMVQHILKAIELKLRENKLDEFDVSFNISVPIKPEKS